MRRIVRTVVCSGLFIFAALAAHAADDQPPMPSLAPGAVPSPPQLKAAPGLSLLPGASEVVQPIGMVRIGVVDLNRVSAGSAMGRAAHGKMKEQQAKLQKQIDTRKKQIEKFKADTERQLPTLSPQQREAKQKEFQKRVEAFQKFAVNAEKEFSAVQDEQTRGLFVAIGKAAEQLGKDKGVAAIVVNRELLYLGAGSEPVDLTAELIQQMDTQQGANK